MKQIEFNYCYKQDRRTFSGHSFGPGNYVSVKKVREIRWFHSIVQKFIVVLNWIELVCSDFCYIKKGICMYTRNC